MRIHGCEDVVGEVIYGLVMDVVFDFEEIGGSGVGGVDGCIPDILGVLNECRVVV